METYFEDFIDDLASVYRWLKAHAGPFVVFCNLFEKILGWSFVRPILSWLNPRKHAWNLPLLVGIVMGMVLLLTEMIVEGGPYQIGRFALVAAVFISLEGSGVVLGYALLAKPLGLFRQVSDDKRSPYI